MKMLIITMGPGETTQGAALGKFAVHDGNKVSFALLKKENEIFVQIKNIKAELIKNSQELIQEIDKKKYDVVFFCNSKMFNDDKNFQNANLQNRPLCVSIDSNWIFGENDSYIKWLDRYFINLPDDVFDFGLKKNNGGFEIPKSIMKKIETVGLVPSYEPLSAARRQKIRQSLKIKPDQKLIFSYFGSGVTFHNDFYQKFLRVFDRLNQKHRDKFRVLYIGDRKVNKPWNIRFNKSINVDWFYQLLASSDLIFQHQGLGTLEQAISAQISVISNVERLNKNGIPHLHDLEVTPFEKAGLCCRHYFDDSIGDVVSSIEKLLFDERIRTKMINSQKAHYSIGEKKILSAVCSLLKNWRNDEN